MYTYCILYIIRVLFRFGFVYFGGIIVRRLAVCSSIPWRTIVIYRANVKLTASWCAMHVCSKTLKAILMENRRHPNAKLAVLICCLAVGLHWRWRHFAKQTLYSRYCSTHILTYLLTYLLTCSLASLLIHMALLSHLIDRRMNGKHISRSYAVTLYHQLKNRFHQAESIALNAETVLSCIWLTYSAVVREWRCSRAFNCRIIYTDDTTLAAAPAVSRSRCRLRAVRAAWRCARALLRAMYRLLYRI